MITIIRNGDDIPLALVQGRDVTLSATVPATSRFFGQVESMFLDFNNGDATRGETVEPYALFGDDTNGDFFGGTMLQLGGQTISLDLFSDDARNNLLETVEFNFNVVDGPNEDPEIVSANANSVDENQTFAIDVQSIDDSDSEGSGLTYSITEGIDADEFDIDPNTGVLTFKERAGLREPDRRQLGQYLQRPGHGHGQPGRGRQPDHQHHGRGWWTSQSARWSSWP